MYQKEIIYMSLYNEDVKEGCVGYLKSEERQGQFRLELQVKNISGNISGSYPLRFQNAEGWQDVDTFTLNAGNGRWSGSAAGPVFGAEIILSEINIIKGQSKNAPIYNKVEEEVQTETSIRAETMPTISEQSTIAPSSTEQILTAVSQAETSTAPEQFTIASSSTEQAPAAAIRGADSVTLQHISKLKAQEETAAAQAESVVESKTVVEPKPRTRRLTSHNMTDNPPIYESKWEQLLATYEKIHPYGDDRVYVKLEPKDFVILPAGYQHLVNNSFLLHGFYNYRYLILGKERDFYLGVPGVFYEREKMVALMFGFEAFECEGGNAEEGKFGYYLRKVEL
ncbi:MAG: hypothetical protein NC433_01185 [Clostridiales bacterium]|nr:hypothetical protein [Clostridiales bacterium]